MRGLAFPSSTPADREASYEYGTPISSNVDDIPIDPALEPPIDPALMMDATEANEIQAPAPVVSVLPTRRVVHLLTWSFPAPSPARSPIWAPATAAGRGLPAAAVLGGSAGRPVCAPGPCAVLCAPRGAAARSAAQAAAQEEGHERGGLQLLPWECEEQARRAGVDDNVF